MTALSVTLECPQCHARGLHESSSGAVCPGCRAAFPTVRGVRQFVRAEAYADTFGYQWTRFARTQLDSANHTTRSREAFVERTGWTPESLNGLEVLDAGCGMGRYAEIALSGGASVHAVDLSAAVYAARENLQQYPKARFYQADIMNLPFAPGSFDRIFSIGVLHHTPSTRRAFERLVPLLREGGEIAIWVYSTQIGPPLGSRLFRPITTRLPRPLLLSLCRLAVPLYRVHRLPLVGRLSFPLLPTSLNPDPEWRWLDTFDWFSPTFQWLHTYAEVEGWFRAAGLDQVWRGPFPVSVRGRRARA